MEIPSIDVDAGRLSEERTENGSDSDGPCVASKNSQASSTVRASGPWCDKVSNKPGSAVIGIRPSDGYNPTMPHHEAGMRTDPPMSRPSASATQPLATAAAEPPLDPPVVRS